MSSQTDAIEISAIIATRDRPGLFERAARSVLEQTCEGVELIVVMDGSQEKFLPEYDEVFERLKGESDKPLSVHRLMHRAKGHGQSYSFNHGVSMANGTFVTFLDDDDEWCDAEHLSRVKSALDSVPTADYTLTNQYAYVEQTRKMEPVWLEDLEPKLVQAGRTKTNDAFYDVSIADLFMATGFCHLNTSIVRRSLWEEVGGMDEGIRWECDRDIFLRLTEAARKILFIPEVISKHYIPNPADKSSMTTSASMVQKRLFQVQVLQKTLANSQNDVILDYARKALAYVSRDLALELVKLGRQPNASIFSKFAQAALASPFWLLEFAKAKRRS